MSLIFEDRIFIVKSHNRQTDEKIFTLYPVFHTVKYVCIDPKNNPTKHCP